MSGNWEQRTCDLKERADYSYRLAIAITIADVFTVHQAGRCRSHTIPLSKSARKGKAEVAVKTMTCSFDMTFSDRSPLDEADDEGVEVPLEEGEDEPEATVPLEVAEPLPCGG